jgi:hypothetical protein
MTKEGKIREMIVTADEWIESLAAVELSPEEARYARIIHSGTVEMLRRYLPVETAGREIDIRLTVFQDSGGRQLIANGEVLDMDKPVKNEYNWHGQNTSQWLFACGIVFDKETRDFSTHT